MLGEEEMKGQQGSHVPWTKRTVRHSPTTSKGLQSLPRCAGLSGDTAVELGRGGKGGPL